MRYNIYLTNTIFKEKVTFLFNLYDLTYTFKGPNQDMNDEYILLTKFYYCSLFTSICSDVFMYGGRRLY